jgi:protein-tyrosine phosphatase
LCYWAGKPELFRKTDGVIPPAMVALLAPYLIAAWLNSRWRTRHQPVAQEIARGVWLGRIPRRAERDALGIESVVDVTAELPPDTTGITWRGVPMLDLLTPTPAQLDAAVKAIDELSLQRPTMVFCALGYSRSAASVAAWLVASGEAASVDEAIGIVQAKRPSIVLTRRYREGLAEWASRRSKNAHTQY